MLKWNPTISVFLGSLISYFEVCSEIGIVWNPFKWLTNFVRWLTYSHKKWKDISYSLHFLSPWLSYALCIYLTFIVQNLVFLRNFLATSCWCSIYILKVKFWLLNRDLYWLNRDIFWYHLNIFYWIQIYFDWIKIYIGII